LSSNAVKEYERKRNTIRAEIKRMDIRHGKERKVLHDKLIKNEQDYKKRGVRFPR